MRTLKQISTTLALGASLLAGTGIYASEYAIDGTDAGMHASVNFRASHMGISPLWGRFNDISGHFTYDADDIPASSIAVTIDPASIDTNHADRDAHLRSSDYLDVEKYPEAGFTSTKIEDLGGGDIRVTGDLTLHGVTREISFVADRVGEGETPFGDYRVGFEAATTIDVTEYGINLFPDGEVELILAIEGIRK